MLSFQERLEGGNLGLAEQAPDGKAEVAIADARWVGAAIHAEVRAAIHAEVRAPGVAVIERNRRPEAVAVPDIPEITAEDAGGSEVERS